MSWMKNPRGRDNLYWRLRCRDGDTCQICGVLIDFRLRHTGRRRAPSIDHFVPRSAGGSNNINNLRITHLYCNTSRRSGDWLPQYALTDDLAGDHR